MTIQEAQRIADAVLVVSCNHTLAAELNIAFPKFNFTVWGDRIIVTRSSLTEEEVTKELQELPARYGYWKTL